MVLLDELEKSSSHLDCNIVKRVQFILVGSDSCLSLHSFGFQAIQSRAHGPNVLDQVVMLSFNSQLEFLDRLEHIATEACHHLVNLCLHRLTVVDNLFDAVAFHRHVLAATS